MTKLLLGSGGFSGSPQTLAYLTEQTDKFFGATDNIIVVPYAGKNPTRVGDWLKKNKTLGERKFELITATPNPRKAVESAGAVLIWGGNTFRLLNGLYANDLLSPIRARVKSGMPYMGVSAGTNVACPTIKTTNDMPILALPSLDALGLVPFQINAHYVNGRWYSKTSGDEFVPYAGETRDDRLREFHEENKTPVVGIPEGTFLKIENGAATYLAGETIPARMFRPGQETTDLAPNFEFELTSDD